MREPIDHETCSSLLGELAAGSLDATRTALVRDHLSSCDRCRSELVAVEALRVGRAARLSDDERRTLHEGILRARPSTAPAVRSRAHRSWGERLVPALAAAAVIAVIAVGAANLFNSGGTGGQSSDATSGAAEALPANGASPRFHGDVGDVGAGGLAHLAERPGKHATASASGTERESDQGLAPLAGAAPPEVGRQIRTCARSVQARRRLLQPAFAATGTVSGKASVIVGFRVGGSRRLSVWAWQRGRCDVPLRVEAGSQVP